MTTRLDGFHDIDDGGVVVEVLPDRFWAKVLANQFANGCWYWCGSTSKDGYGRVSWHGRTVSSHRVAYGNFYGYVPFNGWELDHLCNNRCCVNPVHLEPVTHRTNIRRAHQRRRWNAEDRAAMLASRGIP